MAPRSKYPLRVRYAGTDPVHAAKEHGVKGHTTPCLLWLNPADPHVWCESDAEITCAKCIERLAPEESVDYASLLTPKTGTLHERLAATLTDEIRQDRSVLDRISRTVETWRREAEDRVRLAVNETLAGAIPGPVRSAVADILVERVLRSLDVGGSEF